MTGAAGIGRRRDGGSVFLAAPANVELSAAGASNRIGSFQDDGTGAGGVDVDVTAGGNGSAAARVGGYRVRAGTENIDGPAAGPGQRGGGYSGADIEAVVSENGENVWNNDCVTLAETQ